MAAQSIRCVVASEAQAERLVPILHDAEEDDERIRATLRDPACQAYVALDTDEPVGAAVVRWDDQKPSELLYLAVAPAWRGIGIGRQIVAAVQAALPEHGRTLLVGTANCSLDNIAFYQKCEFRMYEVRRDYFDYGRPPLCENGIVMQDMIVFSWHRGSG